MIGGNGHHTLPSKRFFSHLSGASHSDWPGSLVQGLRSRSSRAFRAPPRPAGPNEVRLAMMGACQFDGCRSRGAVFDRSIASVEGPAAAGRPLRKCPPVSAFAAPSSFTLPGTYRPRRGSACGARWKSGCHGASAGGASAGPPCPCGEVKVEGAAEGRRRGRRRQGYGGPALAPPAAAAEGPSPAKIWRHGARPTGSRVCFNARPPSR